MNKLIKMALFPALAVAAFGQAPPAADNNPMSTWLRNAYTRQ